MRNIARLRILAIAAALAAAACSSQKGYEQAFSNKTALNDNSHRFIAPADLTFKTAKITLIQQGFTIEQADIANGLIKAARSFEDTDKKKFSYLITTSVDVTGEPGGDATIVTMSASQQTVLHKDSEKYYHLLGLVPIPVGKEYQTIVTKEGNVIAKTFYSDFFGAVDRNLTKYAAAAAAAPKPVAPPPAAPAPAPAPAAAPGAPADGSVAAADIVPATSTSGDGSAVAVAREPAPASGPGMESAPAPVATDAPTAPAATAPATAPAATAPAATAPSPGGAGSSP